MLVKASYEASQERNRKEGNDDINPKCFSSVAQQLWYLSKIIRTHVRLLALHCVVIAAQGSTAHASAPLPTCFSASLNSSPSKEGTDGCQVSRANKLQVSSSRATQSPVGSPKLAGVVWKLLVPVLSGDRVSKLTQSHHILFNAQGCRWALLGWTPTMHLHKKLIKYLSWDVEDWNTARYSFA